MTKIWQKNTSSPTGSASSDPVSKKVELFTTGEDIALDQMLIPYDIKASKAHAEGLAQIGILTAEECENLLNGLDEILELYNAGNFHIQPEQEDMHTAIEDFLTEKLGEVGKKIHTGRSRNDQVLVAMRLFEKEQLEKIHAQLSTLARKFLDFAKTHEFVPMPGYTHSQRAMLSSVGMWSASFAEMLIMQFPLLEAIKTIVDLCPLGTAAGFGVGFDLPREFIAQKLGFSAPIIVSLTAQNTRGKIEADIVSALVSVSAVLSHFANDLILYTTKEFSFFTVSDSLTTGSSIMPQKKNFDPAEILRAKHSELLGAEMALWDMTKGLNSGYHRDLQLTKKPVITALHSMQTMLEMTQLFLENITPNQQQLEEKCTSEIFAADAANDLVKSGKTFRDAYQEVGQNLDKLTAINLQENLKSKTHLGATGNLGIELLQEKLK